MTEYFKNFILENENLYFDAHKLKTSFCNALRRIMISEIETIGFRSSYDEDSDIKIEINTSALHNEYLGHRLSLLPIVIPPKDISSFVKDKYEFHIDVINNKENPIDVTSEDISILDTTTGNILSQTETRKFFPPNNITKDFILINRLKPNKVDGIDGEQMKVIMKADRGIGKEHSRYTPTCVSVFTNKIDNSKVEVALKEKLSKNNKTLSAEEIKKISRSFKLSESERHFYTDEKGEPHIFDFNVESDGRIPPQIILNTGIFVLENKLKKLKSNLDNKEVVTFNNSDCIMDSYDVLIKDEDYTIGYLLQQYVYLLYLDKEPKDIKYIATSVPHPLENNLLIRISLENSVNKENSIVNIKKILDGTIDYLLDIIVKLKGEMKNSFKSNLDL